jgi:hypothetical protein
MIDTIVVIFWPDDQYKGNMRTGLPQIRECRNLFGHSAVGNGYTTNWSISEPG